MLDFENLSFHQDRPQKFRLKYLNIASKRTQREKNVCTLAKPFSFFENRHLASYRPHVVEKSLCFNFAPKR